MTERPDPDLLRAYIAVVEHGSFTSAAKRVRRTQSAISIQMKRLEEIVGRPLFRREGRLMRLTADGEIFLDHARAILRTYDEALSAFDDRSMVGSISIGLPDDFARAYLPGILASFSRAYPWVHVDIICDTSRRLMARVAEESIDVALLTQGEAGANGIVVHHEPLVWASSAKHHAFERNPVPLAVFHSGDIFRRHAIEKLEAKGRRARIAFSSLSFAGIEAALESGLAVSVIFRRNLRAGMRILGEREGFPDLPPLGIVLQWVSREPSQLVHALVEHITKSFGAGGLTQS